MQDEVLLLQLVEGCITVQQVGGALQVLLHDLRGVKRGVKCCRAIT